MEARLAAGAVFGGYAAALVLYFLNFELRNASLLGAAKKIIAAALVVHAVFLAWQTGCPVSGATWLSITLSGATFLILLVSLTLEWRFRADYLMLFALPLTLLFLILSAVLTRAGSGAASGGSMPWTWAHLGLILAGLAGLVSAALCALMYLIESHQLKSKHLGRAFFKFPPLDRLERLHFGSLAVGVVLFSLGLLCGLFLAKGEERLDSLASDPQVWISFIACGLYWVVLASRLSAIRRGHKIVVGTLVVFAVVAAAWVGVSGLPSPVHGSA